MKLSQFSEEMKDKRGQFQQSEQSGGQEEDIRKKYEELKDLSSDDLSKRLFEEVANAKRLGTFDYATLAHSIDNMRAFLPNETYENMKRLLETLR